MQLLQFFRQTMEGIIKGYGYMAFVRAVPGGCICWAAFDNGDNAVPRSMHAC